MISTRRGESNCFSRCGPFDDAQGALAKAIALVDADPSTALREPWRKQLL